METRRKINLRILAVFQRCSTWNILLPAVLFPALAFAQGPSYQDPSQPIAVRARDLVSRMTLEEKVGQMMYRAPAIERLQIPAYNWWNEGLHGVARAGYATVFPQAIGLAATWDVPLLHAVAGVISTEARAKYHDALRRGVHAQYFGLTFWSPNINIFRDPRWGRGQETYGEDPFLTAQMGVAFVRGLQGDNPNYLKAISTPKHFAVHSGPESMRHQFNVAASPRDLEETYLPAFRATIEAGAGSVMCAYNSVDGQPACANDMLLKQHLRGAWKFSGYVVSDCGAVDDIENGHHFAPSPEAAAAAAVKAGTDLDCGDEYKALLGAVRQGLISESDIDQAVTRLMAARFRLGMFDAPEKVPYASIRMSENDSAPHRALALKAARESMVLLKNDGVLPFSPKVKRIAVIGPNADSMQVLLGNYNGTPSRATTVLAGMRARFGERNVAYAPGAVLAPGFGLTVPAAVLRPAHGSSEQGLRGEYFRGRDLAGPPVATRVDSIINFDFAEAAPLPGLGPANFSIRWTGVLIPKATGDYQLGANADDGFRVLLDGKVVVEDWRRHGPETKLAPVHLEGGHEYAITMEYFQADWGAVAQLLWEPPNLANDALATANSADAIVMALGISPQLEGEEMPVKVPGFSGGDRTSLDLPEPQQALLEAMAATRKPLVVVLLNGSALAVNWAQQHANAILEAWYPGEEGGTAIADTLSGENNPAGRLPVTFYKSADDLPPFTDYSMQGRTYRYFQGEPLYKFGDGLSYSKFKYSNPQMRPLYPDPNRGPLLQLSVDVENTSGTAGDEVVQAYLSVRDEQETRYFPPNPALVGFRRVHLAAHEKQKLEIVLNTLATVGIDDNGALVPLLYKFHVDIGGHQPGIGTVAVDFDFPAPSPLSVKP